jgi:hypothetical protein
MKMNSDLRQRWIDALRSGNYRQIFGWTNDGANGRCAIGVLQEITWPLSLTEKEFAHVVNLNDVNRWTFDAIASWLERQP